jgi:regulator of nonsense transcripts 2
MSRRTWQPRDQPFRRGYFQPSGSATSHRWKPKEETQSLTTKRKIEEDVANIREEEERRKKEEEKKRKEDEERKRKEDEERKRKEDEEKKLKEDEERKKKEEEIKKREEIARLKQEMEKKLQEKKALRAANLKNPAKQLSDAQFRSLDSSIKKNTSFIKKLSKLSEDTKDSLLKEVKTLNLTKYISEVVHAIAQTTLKNTDFDAAIKICSYLHQTYVEFTPLLIPAIGKTLAPEKQESLSRRRAALRLLTELFIYGVYTDSDILYTIVKEIVESHDKISQSLSLILTFVRYGRELLGIEPKKSTERHAKPKEEKDGGDNDENALGEDLDVCENEDLEEYMPKEMKQNFLTLLDSFYENVCAFLVKEHAALRQKERENRDILQTKGELSQEEQNEYSKMRKAYDKLLNNITNLATLLNKDLPNLPEENMTRLTSDGDVVTVTLQKKESELPPLWEDENERLFYEVFPDLKSYIQTSHSEEVKEKSPDEKDKEKDKKIDSPTAETKDEESDAEKFEKYVASWPSIFTKESVDKAAIDFCAISSRANRRRLVKTLFGVHRTKLELLPYYGRLLAILNQYFKEMGPMIMGLLEEEFTYLFHKKDQINIETKVKNIRFLSEMVKFRICPPNTILNFLKMCLDDFTYHNIDVACNLLEVCGRFLYRTPETHLRTNNLLEIMMRLKMAKNLDNRQDTMVENAYYHVKPPERLHIIRKERTPMQQYIRKLVYDDLNKTTALHVLKKLRKLNWEQDENYILRRLLKVHKGKYSSIHLVASIVAGLSRYHEFFAIKFVDQLLEDIRFALEENKFTSHQRLIMNVKLLGELYNYRLIEHPVVFDMLYTLITYGHEPNAEFPNIDPPSDTFRVRLVCVLLETCGHYFNRGSSKEKLDKFLVYFQRYYLSKPNISKDLSFMIDDIFEMLRPHMKRFKDFYEAHQAVVSIEQAAAIPGKAPPLPFDLQFSAPYKVTKLPEESEATKEAEFEEEDIDSRGLVEQDEAQDSSVRSEDDKHEGFTQGSDKETLEHDNPMESPDVSENRTEEISNENADNEIPNNGQGGDEPLEKGGETKGDDMAELPLEVTLAKKESTTLTKSTESAENEMESFMKEYRKMIEESLEQRKREQPHPERVILTPTIPWHLLKKAKPSQIKEDSETKQVRLLLKKGNRQHTVGLTIPKDSPLAQHHHQEETEEKEEIKRLVMQYAESTDEEDSPKTTDEKKSRKRNTSSSQQQPLIDFRRAQQLERDDDEETQVIILASSSRSGKGRDVKKK